jgi:hypothetical protein
MLFENFELRVKLVKLVCECAANDISKHGLQHLLVAIVVLYRHCASVIAVALCVSLLPHHSDGFVGCLDRYGFDIPDWNTVYDLSLGLLQLLFLQSPFIAILFFLCKIAGLAGQVEPSFKALSLASDNMLLHDVLSIKKLGSLIRNPLKLVVLDLAGDCCLGVVGFAVHFIF